jgi:hypothetical protein
VKRNTFSCRFKTKTAVAHIYDYDCTFDSHLQRETTNFISIQWPLELVALQKMFLSFLPLHKLSVVALIIPSQYPFFNMESLIALASIAQRRKEE